ncbi:MAG: hypothetical protein DA329_12575 [Candidatus Nitrosocosmicus sp.]|nr:hypothetical protein [Candidatus Nitrosocosmicus sp.]
MKSVDNSPKSTNNFVILLNPIYLSLLPYYESNFEMKSLMQFHHSFMAIIRFETNPRKKIKNELIGYLWYLFMNKIKIWLILIMLWVVIGSTYITIKIAIDTILLF